MEVSVPGVEEVKDILRRWEPFHRGASAANQLGNLYPHIYISGVDSRSGPGSLRGLYDDPPASTSKEDFMQIIEDGIQVGNCNFIQSIELVR